MILILHDNNIIREVLDKNQATIQYDQSIKLIESFIYLAKTYPDELLIWCHIDIKDDLNLKAINSVFHHKRVMASYHPHLNYILSNKIGYVDQSFYLKVNKNTRFTTWLSTSLVGGVHASIVNKLSKSITNKSNFDYFLNSLAKLGMSQGLFCYSEPQLLKRLTKKEMKTKKISEYDLYRFVREHYKWFWVYFLTLSDLVYNRKLMLLPLLKSLFYKQIKKDFKLSEISIQSNKSLCKDKTVDVIIPTIGRKEYLYNVLLDLSKQTLLPKNVIIVEQNPDKNALTELDYLTTQNWPFSIKHTFTHQTGVCNARNVALSQVESEWTLLGDDDNRLEDDVIARLLNAVCIHGVKAGTTVYIQPNEIQKYFVTAQTSFFGAGNSLIKSDLLDILKFDKRYEFNYGEDNDFGMKIKQLGCDVIFFSDIKILHLKAPMGGYRTRFKHPWESEKILPKPSPTIMLLNKSYFTDEQFKAYKLLYFIRRYKSSSLFKNIFKFRRRFLKEWQVSLKWANQL
ncbi:glycosyltransferase family 2 protein [Mesoflavibacter sp. CH_XMU1422-2]|uniref:glycosyltransferase family 2 protein n=1 Tax=Mesoflavibacter sp. CH_XMU1422-2 TaxID=3107770 RepID=UPI00300B2B1B